MPEVTAPGSAEAAKNAPEKGPASGAGTPDRSAEDTTLAAKLAQDAGPDGSNAGTVLAGLAKGITAGADATTTESTSFTSPAGEEPTTQVADKVTEVAPPDGVTMEKSVQDQPIAETNDPQATPPTEENDAKDPSQTDPGKEPAKISVFADWQAHVVQELKALKALQPPDLRDTPGHIINVDPDLAGRVLQDRLLQLTKGGLKPTPDQVNTAMAETIKSLAGARGTIPDVISDRINGEERIIDGGIPSGYIQTGVSGEQKQTEQSTETTSKIAELISKMAAKMVKIAANLFTKRSNQQSTTPTSAPKE